LIKGNIRSFHSYGTSFSAHHDGEEWTEEELEDIENFKKYVLSKKE